MARFFSILNANKTRLLRLSLVPLKDVELTTHWNLRDRHTQSLMLAPHADLDHGSSAVPMHNGGRSPKGRLRAYPSWGLCAMRRAKYIEGSSSCGQSASVFINTAGAGRAE
jgi:hypothetical protein